MAETIAFLREENDIPRTIEVSEDNPLPVISAESSGGFYSAALFSAFPSISTDQALALPANAGLRLVGFACRESAGVAAAAGFVLRHGGVAGTMLFPVELLANESRDEWFGSGASVPNGVSIDIESGTVDVVLFYKVVS